MIRFIDSNNNEQFIKDIFNYIYPEYNNNNMNDNHSDIDNNAENESKVNKLKTKKMHTYKINNTVIQADISSDKSFNIAASIAGALPGTIAVKLVDSNLTISCKIKIFQYEEEFDNTFTVNLNNFINVKYFDLNAIGVHFNNGILNIRIPELEKPSNDINIEVKY